MKVAKDAPRRPALRYYGGKWRLAPWIISFFPPHMNYVEPCGGAASVLLQKPRSPLETYNDLDGNVVNFFRVLRDKPDELIRKIRLTPWAREEYEKSLEACEDEVERARRFYFFLWATISAGTGDKKAVNFATITSTIHVRKACRPEILKPESNWANLELVASRFIGVQIENLEAMKFVEKYDDVDTVIYFDPPYVSVTRAQPERYSFEWTDAQHIEAASLLRRCQGYVVISGYACPLYTELYENYGWQRHDRETQTNSGGKRIESVWLSPKTVRALAMPEQGKLL